MNKKTIQAKRNKVLRLLDPMVKRCINHPVLNTNNSPEHEMMKCKIGYDLQKQGYEFVMEATFLNGGRCDVLSLDEARIYEVMVSETKERLESKKYPEELEIIPMRVYKE